MMFCGSSLFQLFSKAALNRASSFGKAGEKSLITIDLYAVLVYTNLRNIPEVCYGERI